MAHAKINISFTVNGDRVVGYRIPRKQAYSYLGDYINTKYPNTGDTRNSILHSLMDNAEAMHFTQNGKTLSFKKDEYSHFYFSEYSGITVIKYINEPFKHHYKIKVGEFYDMDKIEFEITDYWYQTYINYIIDNT